MGSACGQRLVRLFFRARARSLHRIAGAAPQMQFAPCWMCRLRVRSTNEAGLAPLGHSIRLREGLVHRAAGGKTKRRWLWAFRPQPPFLPLSLTPAKHKACEVRWKSKRYSMFTTMSTASSLRRTRSGATLPSISPASSPAKAAATKDRFCRVSSSPKKTVIACTSSR